MTATLTTTKPPVPVFVSWQNVMMVGTLHFFVTTTVGLAIALPLALTLRVDSSNGGCGSMKQFAYEPRSIPPTLLNTLYQDTRQYHPNGCNECSTGRLAVWIAPGDLCTLQRNGSLTEYMYMYPQFQHCGVQKYKNDYEPDHHVKACLRDPDVSVLWETGHCHHNTTSMEPLLRLQKEGLLFCRRCMFRCLLRCLFANVSLFAGNLKQLNTSNTTFFTNGDDMSALYQPTHPPPIWHGQKTLMQDRWVQC